MILAVENLSFAYRRRLILDEISFAIDGEGITAILGPNGSGKTTLLRCINNILKPQTGVVSLDGKIVGDMSGKQIAKSLAYSAQQSASGNISVFDAVLLGRVPHINVGISNEDLEKTAEVIERVGMSNLSLCRLNELSGGEQQKVAIARAMVQQAPVMLLDEPTAALDMKNQMEIFLLLRKIAEERGTNIILSIHDLNTALRFADRFIFIKNGKITTAAGNDDVTAEMIEEVYDVPVSIFRQSDVPMIMPLEKRREREWQR